MLHVVNHLHVVNSLHVFESVLFFSCTLNCLVLEAGFSSNMHIASSICNHLFDLFYEGNM